MDFFNSEFLRQNLVEFSEENLGGAEIHQYRKIKNNRVTKKIVITKNGNLSTYEESVRMFSKAEIVSAIQNIGFDIYKTFGDFLGNKFEQFTSPRLIMICKK